MFMTRARLCAGHPLTCDPFERHVLKDAVVLVYVLASINSRHMWYFSWDVLHSTRSGAYVPNLL